jgi:hypothetical protein
LKPSDPNISDLVGAEDQSQSEELSCSEWFSFSDHFFSESDDPSSARPLQHVPAPNAACTTPTAYRTQFPSQPIMATGSPFLRRTATSSFHIYPVKRSLPSASQVTLFQKDADSAM